MIIPERIMEEASNALRGIPAVFYSKPDRDHSVSIIARAIQAAEERGAAGAMEWTIGPWRYEIQYGPDGEHNYAWLYFRDEMVAVLQTHIAATISKGMNAASLTDPKGDGHE